MTWSTFLRTGHRASCSVHQLGNCSCEWFLYNFTGTLSLFTGFAQIGFGYTRSLAVTSDALHALIDSGTDFFGAFVTHRNQEAPERAHQRIRRFNIFAGLLLIVGVLFLWYELSERLIGGYGNVSIAAVCLLGGLGSLVDCLRLWLVTRADKQSKSQARPGILAHIRSDLYHSLFVLGIGGLLYWAQGVDPRFVRFLPAFDTAGTVIIGIIMMMYAYNLLTTDEGDDSHHHHHE
ncbi:MAG: cation transporter [Candidatus Moraniibacteriota bacterium]|nr:MAG: cation transporter [Candidatus Moranbacteria bacterium]